MWLTGRLTPDFKTIADFRKDNRPAIRATCRQFVVQCRRLDLFSETVIAMDGSRFKAVNTATRGGGIRWQIRTNCVRRRAARRSPSMPRRDRCANRGSSPR
jgi:hypothetical protein